MPNKKFDRPKVSVILSSYNHEKYISEAIESVLNQTFQDFELLIADDGSQDNSREIIKTFSDERIKFFLHEVNRGPRIVLSECLKAAQGKYIAIHHSDDLWTVDKLEKQVKFLEENKNYAACFTQADFIDAEGNLQELSDDDFYKKIFDKPNRSRAEWLRYFFYNANCLCHPSLMIRREVYGKYNLLDFHGLWQLPDYFMWINLCFHENFYIMPDKLVKFRLRDDNMSAADFNKRVRVESEMFFLIQNFVENFKDYNFFLEVFPEAKKFVINGKINREFALAQICLENNYSSIQFVGLNLLKKILSNEKSAEEIKKLYNYDEKSFLVDTGKYDIFGMENKLLTLRCKIYFDTGESFNGEEIFEKVIFYEKDGTFRGKFSCTSKKLVKFLRFDPCENLTAIKLEEFKIKGKNFSILHSNAIKIDEGFYYFLTDDPQFVFDTSAENLQGDFTVEVHGKIDFKFAQKLTDEILFMRKKIAHLEENIINQKTELAKLDEKNKQLALQLEEQKNLNASLINSMSWKVTAPLRKINKMIRSK